MERSEILSQIIGIVTKNDNYMKLPQPMEFICGGKVIKLMSIMWEYKGVSTDYKGNIMSVQHSLSGVDDNFEDWDLDDYLNDYELAAVLELIKPKKVSVRMEVVMDFEVYGGLNEGDLEDSARNIVELGLDDIVGRCDGTSTFDGFSAKPMAITVTM